MHDKLTFTINEAIKAVGLGRTTIHKLINEGHLVKVKVGRRTLITAASLEALVTPPGNDD